MTIREPVTRFLTGLAPQQIWNLEKRGKFPQRYKLNPDADLNSNGACGRSLREIKVRFWIAMRTFTHAAG